jgi:hypothetical protein
MNPVIWARTLCPSLVYSKYFSRDKKAQDDESYLCHSKYINLRPSLHAIVGPVDINLLEYWIVVGLSQKQEGKSAAPMASLDSTIGLRRGRSQESAPPSDSGRVE